MNCNKTVPQGIGYICKAPQTVLHCWRDLSLYNTQRQLLLWAPLSPVQQFGLHCKVGCSIWARVMGAG